MRMASVAMGGSDAVVFPFTMGSEITATFPSPHWRVFTASHASTGEAHTVFSFEKARHDSATLLLARNALQKLKTLRHPSILRYVDSSDTASHLLIATEACTPFQHDFARGDRQREYGMALGLYSVTKAVSWLNNDCKLVHGALCPASIFILRSGEYRLFGLDIAYKHGDTAASVSAASLTPSQRCAFLPPVYRTPEHSKASSSAFFTTIEQDPMSPTPVHYLDSWSLGVLIFDLHSNGTLSSPAQLANKDIIPASLQTEYKRLLSTNPVGRINPSVVLQSAFFSGNELVKTVNFLGELAIQSSGDKDSFFTSFAKQVQEYPEPVNKYRILPQLVDALSFGSGMSCFPSILTSVLKIGGSLSANEYAAIILPAVTKLFSSNERMVRVHLLSCIDQYGQHLTAELINDSIFRHVLTGFHDSQPILREVTMKSMPHFVPKLNAEHLQQALVMLSKMQTDPEPAIRTNTTFCLAKTAVSFNAATREKVLAAAFARALKDPFAPARVAGCVAFAATLDFHSAAVCGRRIIPVVGPLCVDDVSEVREAALKAMSALMQKVSLFHQDGGVERVSAVAEGKKGESAVGSDAAASASALLANVSSWAVSSFASKFYGAGGDIGSTAPQTPSKGIAAHPAFNAPTPSAASMASSPRSAAGDANGTVPTFPAVPDTSAAAELNRDGWDDDFTVDDFGAPDNDEETAAVVTLSTKKRKDAQPTAGSAGAQSRRAQSGSKKKEETKAQAAVEDDEDDGFNDAPFTSAAAPAASSPSLDNWDSFQGALSSTAASGADSSGLSAFDPFSSLSPPSAAGPSQSGAKKKPPLIAGPPGGSAFSAGGSAVKKAGVGKPVVAAMAVKGGKKEDDWASFLNG